MAFAGSLDKKCYNYGCNTAYTGFGGFTDITTDIEGMRSSLDMAESMTANLEQQAATSGNTQAVSGLRARQNDLARQYANVLKIQPQDLPANAAYLTKLFDAIMTHNKNLFEAQSAMASGQGLPKVPTTSRTIGVSTPVPRTTSQNVTGGGAVTGAPTTMEKVTKTVKQYWYVPVGLGALGLAMMLLSPKKQGGV